MGSHTYHSLTIHTVFCTKGRQPLISSDIEEFLYGCFHGIAHDGGYSVIIGNGAEDHVHLLLGLSPSISISNAMKQLKGISSRRLSRASSHLSDFAWQEGFGAFSVSMSQKDKVVRYIKRQKEHHLQETFTQEFMELLSRHRITFDPSVFD